MTTSTKIQTLTIEGRDYALVPTDLLREHAPQLLAPCVPDEGTPWEVVRRTIAEDVSKARAWREYLGLSQEEVAACMGVTQASLSADGGRQTPPQEYARASGESLGHHPGAAEGLKGLGPHTSSGRAVAIFVHDFTHVGGV